METGGAFDAQVGEGRAALAAVLEWLRVNGIGLVYFNGEDLDELVEQIHQRYGDHVGFAISQHVFNLEKAPLDDDTRIAVRKAYGRGITPWR